AAEAVLELCAERLPKFLKTADPLRAIQVLSPTRKGVCGVKALNTLLQQALNPAEKGKKELACGDTLFREGDKVIHIRNDYQLSWMTAAGDEGEGVFNGDMGIVLSVDPGERELTVLFDDDRMAVYDYPLLEELELAYCLSVHKSQGSEFRAVVIPCTGGPPMLMTRNLLYTALTRARELVVLVGRESVVDQMIRNDHIARRYTALRELLTRLNEKEPGA
ncbi:MAG: ATP-dependent RecD-like DNA helicase, partial [Clostridia bacterium]|nr:ATP-dependent RecD-like DNA helicase [Clostridia bacterium]